MSAINSPARPVAAAPEFASLAALHAAHSDLLRRHREAESSAELIGEIVTFLRRGQATGAVLDAAGEREAAQTFLDYWDTTLCRVGREMSDLTLAEFDANRSPELDPSELIERPTKLVGLKFESGIADDLIQEMRNAPADELLRGEVLAEAGRCADLPGIVVQFLACSRSSELRLLVQRRNASRLGLAGFAIIALLTVGVLVSWSVGQSQLPGERADVALSRQLVAQSAIALRDGQRDLALLLSVEALRAHDAVEARSGLLTALAYAPDSILVGDQATPINGLTFSSTSLPFARVARGRPVEAAAVAFSPDGKVLAFGGYDGTLVIWDLTAGQRRALLLPPSATPAPNTVPAAALDLGNAAVTAVAFRPDGKILAAGSAGGALTLWDLDTAQPLAPPFKVHTAPLTSLSFSPDGKTLASGSADLPLVTWSVDVQSWADLACGVANRSLTPAEQQRYLGDRRSPASCPELGPERPGGSAEDRSGQDSQPPDDARLGEGAATPDQADLPGARGTWPDPVLWRSERAVE